MIVHRQQIFEGKNIMFVVVVVIIIVLIQLESTLEIHANTFGKWGEG